jgi:hypothetical protein
MRALAILRLSGIVTNAQEEPCQRSMIKQWTSSRRQNVLLKSLRAADEKDWTAQAEIYAENITIDFGGVQPTKTTTPLGLWV